jgi:hypothetical protein
MDWDAFDLESAFPQCEPLKSFEICLTETKPPEMNPQPEYRVMNLKRLLPCLTAILLASPLAFGDTIAQWTFETSQPGVNTLPAAPGAGNWLTNIVAENGSGTAAGLHAGAATYSSTAGNGSAHSFSANTWAVGDFAQFAASTIGFQNVTVSFDQISSSTGPGVCALQYSTDGITFTQFGSTYIVSNAPAWSSSSYNAFYSHSYNLSAVSALNNAPVVYFRVVAAVNLSSSAATNTPQGTTTIAATGTDRIDNFTISATTIPGPVTFITQPQSKTAYWGDTVNLSVAMTGTSPFSYQWYYPDLNSPLSDGSSGYGVGTIAGSTSNTLVLAYVNTNQAGNYQVIVNNSLGSITSQVAQLTVNVRTPIVTNIAYLRAWQNPTTWMPNDTTNLYSVTGVVTTPINISGSGNSSEFYMQDGASGICVFVGGGTYLPNPGDLVRVIGPVANYNGLLEFNLSASNPAHSVSYPPISSGNTLPAHKVFDIANYSNIPYMETNVEGSLVVVSNVFLQQSTPQFVSGSTINMTNVNRKYFSLYINAGSDVIAKTIPQFAASIAGVMGQFTTTVPATNGYELLIIQYSDLVSGTAPGLPMPLQIQRAGTNVLVSWWAIASYTLQTATSLNGTYTDVTGATSPVTNSISSSPTKFYRLKQN